MPGDPITYEIDDTQSVDQNIAIFSQKLAEFDPVLGPVLAAHLSAMESGQLTVPVILAALEQSLLPSVNMPQEDV